MEQAQACRTRIKLAGEELERIQNQCSHPKEVLKKTDYCVDAYAERPRYYSQFSCGICGYFWMEDKENENV